MLGSETSASSMLGKLSVMKLHTQFTVSILDRSQDHNLKEWTVPKVTKDRENQEWNSPGREATVFESLIRYPTWLPKHCLLIGGAEDEEGAGLWNGHCFLFQLQLS